MTLVKLNTNYYYFYSQHAVECAMRIIFSILVGLIATRMKLYPGRFETTHSLHSVALKAEYNI